MIWSWKVGEKTTMAKGGQDLSLQDMTGLQEECEGHQGKKKDSVNLPRGQGSSFE